MSIYPNPNNGVFSIDIEMATPADMGLALFDLSGKAVYQKQLNHLTSHREDVRVGQLSAGLYVLKVQVKEKTYFHKIVIQ